MKKSSVVLPAAERDLIAAYVDAAAANGAAIDAGDYRTANHQHDRGVALSREVAQRGVPAQRRLVELLQHDNPWVRFWAAGDVRQIAPIEAEQTLAQLASLPPSVVRLSAETLLTEWKNETRSRS